MTKCVECNGKGYVYSNDEHGIDEVQRCDECRVLASDEQAQAKAYIEQSDKTLSAWREELRNFLALHTSNPTTLH
jgi:hypothetical protein